MSLSVSTKRTGDVQLRAQSLADNQTDFEEIVIRNGGRAPSASLMWRPLLTALTSNSGDGEWQAGHVLQAKSTDDMGGQIESGGETVA